MTKALKRAIVIIPTYNEREAITPTLSAVLAATQSVEGWAIEILVVDDSSPDGTAKIVKSLAKDSNRIHLLVNPKKMGLGGAYLAGMAAAFDKYQADVVFEFDADLQHPPQKIPDFLRLIDAGADLVLGCRYTKGGGIPQEWGLHRKFLSQVGNWIIAIVLTNFSIHDWTSGYRAVTKPVYEAVHPLLHSERFFGYAFQIGFLYNAIKKGFRVELVPYYFGNRTVGESKIGPEYIKNTLAYIFQIRFNEIIHHRLFKFAMVGGIGALVQLSSLTFFRTIATYQLAYFFSVEMAVLSNFIWSNLWTFADRKLSVSQLPLKFVQFNLASAGSILIQQLLAAGGEWGIGLHPLFRLPIIGLIVDTGLVFAVTGILIGMLWNYFAYTKFIWRARTHVA